MHAPGGNLSQKWGQREARGPQAPCWRGPTPARVGRPPGWVLPPLVPYQDSYLFSSRGNPRTEVVFPVSVAESPPPSVLLRGTNLEVVLASGEGRSSPSSSPSPLHHPSMTSPFMFE